MSKKDIVTNPETTGVVETTAIPVDENAILAYLIKKEDGYHIEDLDGNVDVVCKLTADKEWILFTKNAANRKCASVKSVEKFFTENPDGKIGLKYKATRTIGSTGPKLPNEKLISYLPEAEQEEYRAIIARAIAARDAEKNRPLTPLEKAKIARDKAMARLNKVNEELAALEAEMNS